MKSIAMRVAVLAAVVSLSSMGNEAYAGFRHLRMFRSSCCGPTCGCSAPVYVSAPMPTSAYAGSCCSMPGCSMPGCSMPQWGGSAPKYGSPSDFQPAWSGPASVGYESAMSFDPDYATAPVYGATDPARPFQNGGNFDVRGFGGAHVLPGYYAPMSAHYAPIRLAPAADIVW